MRLWCEVVDGDETTSSARCSPVYIAQVENVIILQCQCSRYTIVHLLGPSPQGQELPLLELAEADRYPPQLPSDLHGRVVRLSGNSEWPGGDAAWLAKTTTRCLLISCWACCDWLQHRHVITWASVPADGERGVARPCIAVAEQRIASHVALKRLVHLGLTLGCCDLHRRRSPDLEASARNNRLDCRRM